MLAPGSRIDAYDLLCPVGEGGMAQVWVARRHGVYGFEKLVAIKVVHGRLLEDARTHAMFLDEAKISAEIQHPNVAQVFDLGEVDDMLYLVMEYVDGESLSGRTAAGTARDDLGAPGLVPIAEALRITRDVCAGLHAAHTTRDAHGNLRGIVHRDVSPQNVLIGARGEVKVIDFGIAYARNRLAGETRDGAVRGKLVYMAPEQVRQKPLGPSADVFGTGATLFTMLVGRGPFAQTNDAATLQRLMAGRPVEIPPDVPEPVREILARALELDPEQRYPTAAAMMEALDAAAAQLDVRGIDLAPWAARSLSREAHATRERVLVALRTPAAAAPEPTVVHEIDDLLAVPELHAPPQRPPPLPARDATPAPGPHAGFELDHASPVGDGQAVLVRARPSGLGPIATLDGPRATPSPRMVSAPPPREPREPREPAAEPSPEFFDVRALAAQANEPAGSAARGGHAGTSNGDAASAVDAPSRPAGTRRPASRPDARAASSAAGAAAAKRAVAVVVVLCLAAVAAAVAAPLVVRQRLVDGARAAGVELTIDGTSVSLAGVTLRGVTARAADMPGCELRVGEVQARGFDGADVRLADVTAELAGTALEVTAGLARASERVATTTAAPPGATRPRRHVLVTRARVGWVGLLGANTKLAADGVGLEIEERAPAPVTGKAARGAPFLTRGAAERATLTLSRGTLGPWGLSFEVDGLSNRIRTLFDPALPDGPSALYLWGPSTAEKLTVKVPRVPLATLGVPPEMLGLPPRASPELELRLEVAPSPLGRVEAKAKLDAFRVPVPLHGKQGALDIHVDGSASGARGKPLDLERTTVALGPFVAGLTGTVDLGLDGAHAEGSWKLAPFACEKLARREAESLGPLAVAIQEIGAATGIARVTGTAQASGTFLVDTGSPTPALVRARTSDTCGVRLFGALD